MNFEDNKTTPLNSHELTNIKGGHGLWVGVIVGYLFGEVMNGIQAGLDRRAAGECC